MALGHGAGGGVGSRDLLAATAAALRERCVVALVEQPYRVAGRRAPAPQRQLDAAWVAVIERFSGGPMGDLPLIVGGRSMGARVACRTASDVNATGVLCLAFPLRPPRRKNSPPAPDRLEELERVEVPCLIVQGLRDPFGMPPAAANREVVPVDGDHSLRTGTESVTAAVTAWLARVLDLERRQP